MTSARNRELRAGAVAAAVVIAIATLGQVPPASAAGASISFDDPAAAGSLTAGTDVTLKGAVTAGPTSTVLYALDVSGSTNAPANLDCNGSGAAEPGDDLNGDAVQGDLLDCEIAAVQTLDASLAQSSANVWTGLEAWSGTAAMASLSPDATVNFLPAGNVGDDTESQIHFVSRYLVRNTIRKYNRVELNEAATSFDAAARTAMAALATAPAGPKWLMLMSDVISEGTGTGSMAQPVSQAVLDELAASKIHVRTFALGGEAGCAAGTSLARMAAVTGESCIAVSNPSALTAGAIGAQPDGVRDVTVRVGGLSVAADVDAVGGWSTKLKFGAGTYTATATARFTSGATLTATRSFTVGAAAPGTNAPAPGSVVASAGTLVATRVGVRRPAPTRFVVPRTVRGKVGLAGKKLGTTAALDGSKVVLQGQAGAGTPWKRLDRASVQDGRYLLSWKGGVTGVTKLRVALVARGKYAASVTDVPRPKISSCTVRRHDGVRTVTCKTTIDNGTKARLLDGSQVLDRSRVRRGQVRVTTDERLRGTVLVVDVSKKKHVRLTL